MLAFAIINNFVDFPSIGKAAKLLIDGICLLLFYLFCEAD